MGILRERGRGGVSKMICMFRARNNMSEVAGKQFY